MQALGVATGCWRGGQRLWYVPGGGGSYLSRMRLDSRLSEAAREDSFKVYGNEGIDDAVMMRFGRDGARKMRGGIFTWGR